MDVLRGLSDEDLAGLFAIVAVVGILSWFGSDLSGADRVVTVILAVLVAALAAIVSLHLFRALD